MELRAGSTIAGYVLVAELAAGGQGRVWQAVPPCGGPAVAIKLMRPELATEAKARRRFLREMRAAMTINHRGLVRTIDAGDDDGVLWISSELADGGSLKRRLPRRSHLPANCWAPLLRSMSADSSTAT